LTLLANPLVTPSAYDVIKIAGVTSPGVFKLHSGGRRYKWDVKFAKGSEGATETYQGWDPKKDIKGTFQFWRADQIDTFYQSFVPLLKYDATKTNPQPVPIEHPVLFESDILSVVTQEIGPLTDLGRQLWSVTVEWIEFAPAKKKDVTTTPNAMAQAIADAVALVNKSLANPPKVLTANQLYIQQLIITANKP
jgi:hypothetical protein